MPLPPSILDRIPPRLLLGPGPSNSPESVLRVSALPLVGHLDPVFTQILDELQGMLRQLFQTENKVTFAASGTGSAGMELLAANLFEPGDEVIVGRNGVFGGRIGDALTKLGARPIPVDAPWGEPIAPDAVAAAWKAHPDAKAVWIVHAETSTGVLQPAMEAFGAIARSHDGLFLVDCVTSLGGAPVRIDAWQADAAFSGTQKCLNVTPGLAPVTLGERALAKLAARKHPVPSWYFDLSLLTRYWTSGEGTRVYHHTAPITSVYALHEGARLALEEGLENRWASHLQMGDRLTQALEALGFRYRVGNPEHRAPMLHAVIPPEGKAGRRPELLAQGIEVGAGLGEWAGDTWRVGLMGINASEDVIETLVAALRHILS